MISEQTPVYLLVPDESNERVLHPGKVVASVKADVLLLSFEESVAPPVGADANVFFERQGKFLQQHGTIIAGDAPVSTTPGERTVAIRCVEAPVSAESRDSYRVSVVGLDTSARVENERKCPLLDISPEGIALVTKKNYLLGTPVRIAYEYDGETLEGRARVQTVRQLPSGGFRSGLLVPSTETEMRRALQKITAVVQRHHLRNLRRSA